jgi:hypothetical protein
MREYEDAMLDVQEKHVRVHDESTWEFEIAREQV